MYVDHRSEEAARMRRKPWKTEEENCGDGVGVDDGGPGDACELGNHYSSSRSESEREEGDDQQNARRWGKSCSIERCIIIS